MRKTLLLILAVMLLAGCTKSYRTAYTSETSVRKQIVSDAKHYIGVRYKYGGTTPSGFDCSGFTQFIYRKNGIDIPRTVTDIQDAFSRTKKPRIGDVVVFNNPKHIGILIGGDKFIHASVTKGIMISKLTESWYRTRIIGYYSYFH